MIVAPRCIVVVAVRTVAALTPTTMDDIAGMVIADCRRSLPHRRRRRPLQTAKSYGAYLPWTFAKIAPHTPHKFAHKKDGGHSMGSPALPTDFSKNTVKISLACPI